MQRRTFPVPRRVAIVVALLAVVAVLAVGTMIWRSRAADDPGGSGVVETAWGPLTPADRDLLVMVRRTCLWEVSIAQQAQRQASSPAVKEATRKILAEHADLDQQVRDVADKLGVLLPDAPDARQVAWTKEISAVTGPAYDRTVVQRLREADGYVLPLAQQARVGTRNDVFRVFARDTLPYVIRHVGWLEGTGLVDYSALPEPPAPTQSSTAVNWRELIVPVLVLLACLLVAVTIGVTLRNRNRSTRPAATPVAAALGIGVTSDPSRDAPSQAHAADPNTPTESPPTGSLPASVVTSPEPPPPDHGTRPDADRTT